MDQNNPYPTSPHDSFNYDPNLSFDDDLHQLVNSVIPPTPQNVDVSTFFPENNQQPQDHTLLANISSSIHASQSHQAITPHEQDNVAAAAAPAPSKGKGKKKPNARDVERQRRQEMASLYHDFRSILPEEYVKGRRSKSDLLQETINYINNLQLGIEELNEKKDKLSRGMKKRSAPSRGSSSNNNTITPQQIYNLTVNPCQGRIIEIIVNTNATYDNDNADNDDEDSNQSLPLSKVLHKLNEEGLNVINCVSSRIDENMVHTIQAQADDGREIDLGLLQQTLTYHY